MKFEDILAEHSRWQKQIDDMMGPSKRMYDDLMRSMPKVESIVPPPVSPELHVLGETIRKLKLQALHETQELQKHPTLEEARRFNESVARSLEPMRSIVDELNRTFQGLVHIPQWEMFVTSLRRQPEWFDQMNQEFRNLISTYMPTLESIRVVADTGQLVFEGQEVSREEIADAISAVAAEIGTQPLSPPLYVRKLSAAISKLPKAIARLVGLFIFNQLCNLTTPEFQPWWQALLGQPRPEATATVNRLAVNVYGIDELLFHRVVVADQLRVRKQPGGSEVTAVLRRGKIVKLAEVKGKWALIEYASDNPPQTLQHGWVSERYLARFQE